MALEFLCPALPLIQENKKTRNVLEEGTLNKISIWIDYFSNIKVRFKIKKEGTIDYIYIISYTIICFLLFFSNLSLQQTIRYNSQMNFFRHNLKNAAQITSSSLSLSFVPLILTGYASLNRIHNRDKRDSVGISRLGAQEE